MKQQDELFERIFSDAHVVDIDLSQWDKKIGLYVLADHAERTASGRLPLFLVEFVGVRQLELVFNHLSLEPPIAPEPDRQAQWRIDEFLVEPAESGVGIALWQRPTGPRLSLVCADVAIRDFPLEVPDRFFPGWTKPFTGFIRPGLDALARERRTKR